MNWSIVPSISRMPLRGLITCPLKNTAVSSKGIEMEMPFVPTFSEKVIGSKSIASMPFVVSPTTTSAGGLSVLPPKGIVAMTFSMMLEFSSTTRSNPARTLRAFSLPASLRPGEGFLES